MSLVASSLASGTPPSSSYELLGPQEAATFYEDVCRREGLHIHSTFLKQVLQGSVLIQFEHGYLGVNGISAIVQTLQRIPLRALLLSQCALSLEDVKLLCAGLATHPQLEKLDVRGVDITVGAAKELLHLAVRNAHLTAVLMDERAPKYVAVQQQCERNAQAAVGKMSACVVCGAGVAVEAQTLCETLVVRFVLEHLKPHMHSISAAGLIMLCGALKQCVDRNDGILSVCGEVCGEALAEDLCRCVWSVAKALVWKVPYDLPKTAFLRTFLLHKLDEFQRDVASTDATPSEAASAALSASSGMLSKSFLCPGPVDEQAEECWRTKKPRNDIDDFFDDSADRDVSPCDICGQPGVCSTDGPTWLLRTLQIEVEEHGVAVTPAALLRLCHTFANHAAVRPCSRRCLRHLVRYALYGYGGVNCSYVGGFPPLSSALGGAAELLRLPLVDFAVVDIAATTVHDVASEEINCALTVASTVGDTDGVAMDPYLIFSIGRQLRKMSPRSIGMDLASACEAVRLVGCLPEKDAPYKRHSTESAMDGDRATEAVAPRDLVANWSAWSAASGQAVVRQWLHTAFAHRRQRVCTIDGPHRDLFDNIRAVLWALRPQARSVLVTVKVSMAWLSLKDGVVPATTPGHTHGFYTTAKVIGQSTRASTVYLILQCPLGRHVCHNGLLYIPKTVFLHCVRGLAFVFADAATMEYRPAGWRASLYAAELVGPALGVAAADLQRLRQLFMYVQWCLSQGRRRTEGVAWRLVGSRVPAESLRGLFDSDHLPPALAFLRHALGLSSLRSVTAASQAAVAQGGGARHDYRTYWERILFSSRYPSQLLFFFSEMVGSGRWLQQAVAAAALLTAAPPPPVRPTPARGDEQDIDASPTPAPANTNEVRKASETAVGGGDAGALIWQTLGSVPELSSLPYDSAVFDAATAAAKADTIAAAKGGRKKGNTQLSTSAALPDATSGGRPPRSLSPKPPTALLSAQTSSWRRVGGTLAGAKETSATDPSNNVNTTTNSSASTSRPSSANNTTQQDKLQMRLQKGWRAERMLRNAFLQDAASVGVMEYLRTRTQASPIGARATGSSGVLSPCSDGSAPSSTSFLNDLDQDLPLHLLGRPWFVVPVRFGEGSDTEDGVPSDLHLLFIGNSVCVYSMHESRLLCRPALLSADPLMVTFPFASGVDAATPHPTNADFVFFFSGREWLLFNVRLLECVDGPYPLSEHGQFRKLPSAFHDGVDSAIAIPNTSQLVFFRDYEYVVFDVHTRRCVGGVGQMDLHVASVAPAARRNVDPDDDSDDDTAIDGTVPAMACPLVISSDLQHFLDVAPMSWFTTRKAAATFAQPPTTSYWLVSRRGEVVEVEWTLCATDAGGAAAASAAVRGATAHGCLGGENESAPPQWVLRCLSKKKEHPPSSPVESSMPAPPLSQLPLVFRQSSTHILPALCTLAVKMDFCLEDAVLTATRGSSKNGGRAVYGNGEGSGGSSVSSAATSSSARLELFDPEMGDRELLAATRVGLFDTDDFAHSPHASLSSTMDADTAHSINRRRLDSASGTAEDDAASSCELAEVPAATTTTITSSLTSTSVARRMPLALSRNGPVVATHEPNNGAAETVAASHDWGQEVFFYGSENADTAAPPAQHAGVSDTTGNGPLAEVARPRLFIEYDLGSSAPRRSFAALLLVLDTLRLPTALLQLAPLTAAVESSTEGAVYLPQAVVRITGPFTAARWGGSPLTVEPEPARFWRLRFDTPIPAVVGIVRLFWFEASQGLPRQAIPVVPLSTCAVLPLMVHKSDGIAGVGAQKKGEDADGVDDGMQPVSIEAESVVASPELLLRGDNMLPVFVDNPSQHARGWYGHHTAFPVLLHSSTSCFVGCGAAFTEVHVGKPEGGGTAALPPPSAVAQSLAEHPSFAGLPYPFVLGWDASFYPSPQDEPGLLCFICGDVLLLWDMADGVARGGAVAWRHSALLDGLSATPVARVVATVNCWSATGKSVVAFVYEPSSVCAAPETQALQYLEFDLGQKKVVSGPTSFATHLQSRYGASTPTTSHLSSVGATLLTVLCSPHAPSTWYVFYERMVLVLHGRDPRSAREAAATVAKTAPCATSADYCRPVHLSESPLFFAVPIVLPAWGSRQRRCNVTLDLASLLSLPPSRHGSGDDSESEADGVNDGALVAGMQLLSSGGRSGTVTMWRVQCSEQGRSWEDVAVHRQKSGERVLGESMWAPRATGRHGKARFWRFVREFSADDSKHGSGGENVSEFSDSGCCDRGAGEEANLQTYFQLRLLSVPRKRCAKLPVRVSGADASTSSVAVCSAFFAEGTRTAKLALADRQADSSNVALPSASASTPDGLYELVWDYGLSLTVLSGIAFTVEDKPPSVQLTWTLYGSSDADSKCWTHVATTAMTNDTITRCSLSWVPNGPYRYWRLLCTAARVTNLTSRSNSNNDRGPQERWPATLTLSALHAFEYGGPLASLQSSTGIHLNATSLLWPSAREPTMPDNLASSGANIGILFNRVTDALTWCKVDFLVSSECTVSVAMECSADAREWFTVALATLSVGNAVTQRVQEAVLSWQSCGSRRLWRLRVVNITSDVTFLPVRLYLGSSPAERLLKLSSRELLPDAVTPAQQSVPSPTPSRRSSVQVVADKPLSFTTSAVSAAAAMLSDGSKLPGAGAVSSTAVATTDLCLEVPQRILGVRAVLPSAASRYAVEYLGLDGVSWLLAAVLEDSADTQKERQRTLSSTVGWVASAGAAPAPATATAVWWDAAAVSPSTQWRLRPLPPRSGDAAAPAFGSTTLRQQQEVRTVEWFANVGKVATTVDTSEVPGVVVSTTGFTEVQPPRCLSGTDKASFASAAQSRSALKAVPVLQCTVLPTRSGSLSGGPAVCAATWSFISPILLDQLTLQLRATPQPETQSAKDEAASPKAPAAATKGEAPVQSVWVETSDNGVDFVAVAQTPWWPADTTVTLTWEEVPPACFWRLRLSKAAPSAVDASGANSVSGQRSLSPYVLEIFAARWGVCRSSSALMAHVRSAPPGSFTNTSYRAWLADQFNNEDAFMRDCQNAFDEVRSTESKLRTEESLSAPAVLAAAVQKMRTKYQTFIQKAAKEAARQVSAGTEENAIASSAVNNKNAGAAGAVATATTTASAAGVGNGGSGAPLLSSSLFTAHQAHARWLSPEYASSDVMLLLLVSAASASLGGEKLLQLAELVDHPLALREAFKFIKKPTRWFYPYLEVVGQVAQDWYGFSSENLFASFCVYWSLSSALQRRKDALLAPGDLIPPLSEHVASPLVVMQINELNWSPNQHFPSVPFLYAVNFHERPTTVVFALNDVTFTPPYALSVPSAKDSQALISPYPYTVYAGINFVQTRMLESCPAPLFDVLRYILPPSLFRPAAEAKTAGNANGHGRSSNTTTNNRSNSGGDGNGEVLMVLTTPSLQQQSGSSSGKGGSDAGGDFAQLRFTVPADGVNFGMRDLVIDTLEFEIAMKADGPGMQWSHKMTFISHGARFVSQGSENGDVATEVAVSLLGCVDTRGLPVVGLRGTLGNARITSVAGMPGAVVTNVFFHTIAQIEKVPAAGATLGDIDSKGDGAAPRWVCLPLQSEARVMLPGLADGCGCTCVLDTSTSRDGALEVSQLQMALPRSSLCAAQVFCLACSNGIGALMRQAALAPLAQSPQLFNLCGVHVQLAASIRMASMAPAASSSSLQAGDATGSTAVPTSTTTTATATAPFLRGQALLYLDNNVLQGASVEVNCEQATVAVMATCTHPLRFGALVMLGSEESPILLQLLLCASPATQRSQQQQQQSPSQSLGAGGDGEATVTPPAAATHGGPKTPYASHRLLIAGSAYFFGQQQAARVSLELSWRSDTGQLATLVAHSLRHRKMEASIQDSAVSPAWRYAQITVDEAVLRQALAQELGNVPIVAALCAHGIPLTCVVSSVAAAPFDVVSQRLSLRVKGLLFGTSFDAATSVVCPDDVEDVWSLLAARLCPEVVEQCEENLWASYTNVIGCRTQAPQDAADA